MPLHPQAEALLQQLAAGPPISSLSVEDARAAAELLGALGGEQVSVGAVCDITIPVGEGASIGARVYTPPGPGPFHVVVFMHGGGFVIGSLDSHDNLARTICRDADAIVVSLDYRMGPEHRFPTAPEDCYAAVAWVEAHAAALGADASKLALCGDSAGGNLAAVVSQLARDRHGGPAIRFAALIYPSVDMTFTGGSRESNGKGYLLEQDDMDWFLGHYLRSDADRTDPRASPALHPDLAGLPACFIATCEFDPLRDEAEAYADALRAHGVTATVRRYDGLIHGAASMAGVLDGGRDLVADVCSRIRVALH